MKINTRFNLWSKRDYYHYINNYKKYTNFNTLGLYRSILENKKLSLEDQLEVRDYANEQFQKTFDFLQLKDPWVYRDLVCLGLEMTVADKAQQWKAIRQYQEAYLKKKKIKHRNFGTFSKHDCGYPLCPMNGLMTRQGSPMAECVLYFDTDHYRNQAPYKRVQKHRPDWEAEAEYFLY
jgi:hypothetical protein